MAQIGLILVALAVARSLVLRRDYIAPIGERPYRGGWKLFVGIIVLLALQIILVVNAPGQSVFQMLIMTSFHLGATAFFLLNRHIPGVKLVILGAVFNIVVALVNGGWMPLTPDAAHFVYRDKVPIEVGIRPLKSKSIVIAKEDTNLWILSDIIRIKVPWRRAAISIGDVLLLVGIAQFIFQVKAKEERRDSRGKRGRVALAPSATGDPAH